MKQINITQYSKPDMDSVYLKDHLYCVFIGIRRVYFKSEVKTKRFIAETNRLLNSILNGSNYLYYNLFSEYRKVWFYLDDRSKYSNIEEQMVSTFNSIDKSFTWLVNRTATSMNGNANAFSFTDKILRELLIVANFVKGVLTDKDKYSESRTIDIYINQIFDLLKQLNSWGKEINKKFDFIKENDSTY